MDTTFSFLNTFLSMLGLCYFLSTTVVAEFELSDNDIYQIQDIKVRALRDTSKQSPRCGATAIRLNLDMKKLYGKWYPVQVSESAYTLWMTSLYGTVKKIGMTNTSCLVMEFNASSERDMLDVELTHKDKSMKVQATLLGDALHPGKSKWVISWPNGEDTLTSIVATGTRKGVQYDWMLTADCDLNGIVSPDWAIFSRQGLSKETIESIKAIVDGMAGLRLTKTRQMGNANCTFN